MAATTNGRHTRVPDRKRRRRGPPPARQAPHARERRAPPGDAARNRWPWLAVNLGTAFIASRIIGAFEATIQQLVALAALMPIVASVGGNTGNQTVALVVRGLAAVGR